MSVIGVSAYAELRHKDVVTIECLGHIKTEKGYRWLDGRTHNGTVGLAPTTTGGYTGTKWEVYEVEKDVYAFKSLGHVPSENRWLDGHMHDGTVGLAPTRTGGYTGTNWKLLEIEDGVYTFKCVGHIKDSKYIWLDGRTHDGTVGLAPTTTGHYTGTSWRIHKIK